VIPVTTETIVIIILLAGFIYGAVATSTGRDACSGLGRREGGDGDEQGGNAARGSGTACSLTKASTAFTVSRVLLGSSRTFRLMRTGRKLLHLLRFDLHCRQGHLGREALGVGAVGAQAAGSEDDDQSTSHNIISRISVALMLELLMYTMLFLCLSYRVL
jgi:hypothetical protein